MAQSSTTRAITKQRQSLVDFNPKVPSRGLTMTTPWGPIDLVAIERAVRGHAVKLDAAEDAWLRHRSHPSYGRDIAADRLGINRARFEELVIQWRAKHVPTNTPTEA
jgi:hypothetical protein